MKMISKKTLIDYKPDYQAGEVVLIDKSQRKSSFDCVYKVRKAIEVKKVGHAGTLDPSATGLVIVCTGRMTKEISGIQGQEKNYIGIITLGKTTASYDAETPFESAKDFSDITNEEIYGARDSFVGLINQVPPMYSAVKIHGKALYKYARKGVDIERKSREVIVSKFEITGIDLPDIQFDITCTKGTYIRVIANDLGQKLGCGAYLKSLRRISIGEYNVKDAFSIEEFKEYAKHNLQVGSEII
jgi:tRNA pseudouridine55 synthase